MAAGAESVGGAETPAGRRFRSRWEGQVGPQGDTSASLVSVPSSWHGASDAPRALMGMDYTPTEPFMTLPEFMLMR